jgi:Domain of unknown function (DUF5062)
MSSKIKHLSWAVLALTWVALSAPADIVIDHYRPAAEDARMKKLKHESELFKAALLAGVQYAEGRKAVEFEATDSASLKALYVYRLLVHDKVIAPMPEEQVSEKTIRHRLATWYAHQLPKGHPLTE